MTAGTTPAEFIAGFEGYAGRAYWDVNAWRLGYGSDTEGPDQVPVTEEMETTKPRALQNLALRIPEFAHEAIYGKTGMGAAAWAEITENQRTAILSLVYNYGRLPVIVTPSDSEKTAAAIRGLQNANGGVNRKRRIAEAALYLTADAVPTVASAPAPVPQVPSPPVAGPAAPAGLPQVSASSAGRRAAVQDAISAMREALVVERAAIDAEIAILDTTAADFAKLDAATAIPALQQPAAGLAVTQKGTLIMPTLVTGIITNWVTSLFGTAAGSPAIIDLIGAATGQHTANWNQDVPLLATMIIGWFAKDGNVTGGTVPQTTEAAKRTGTPLKGTTTTG